MMREATSLLLAALHAVVDANQAWLGTNRAPQLYESGVACQDEPMAERIGLIPDVIVYGHGTPAELAAWRCAELRHAGKEASLRIVWQTLGTGTKVPVVQVRIGKPAHAIEDPAQIVRTLQRERSKP